MKNYNSKTASNAMIIVIVIKIIELENNYYLNIIIHLNNME